MSEGGEGPVAIPAVTQRINEDMTLTTRTVAQAESTRSYFLAQTLESTRTVPIVSANLPLDTSAVDAVEPAAEGEGSSSQDEESDDGEDDPDADDPVDASFTLASYEDDSGVSAESTVIGSFTYRGITYAVDPGGESVAIMAADYAKLPEEFIEAQTIVLPSAVTPGGINYYSVTRIADHAFSSMAPQENAEDITVAAIPASITEIGDDAFTSFDTLQYVVVSEDNPNYSMYDGCLYDADQTSLLLIPEGRLGAVWVAPNTTTISEDVSSHCASVTSFIVDPDSAASQLLSESDFYNVNGDKIEAFMNSSQEVSPFTPAYAAEYSELSVQEEPMPEHAVSAQNENIFIRYEATDAEVAAYNAKVKNTGGTCKIMAHSCHANWVVPVSSFTNVDLTKGIERKHVDEGVNYSHWIRNGTYTEVNFMGNAGQLTWGIHPLYGLWFGTDNRYFICMCRVFDEDTEEPLYYGIFESYADARSGPPPKRYTVGAYYASGNFTENPNTTSSGTSLDFDKSSDGKNLQEIGGKCVWDPAGGTAAAKTEYRVETTAPSPGTKTGYTFDHWENAAKATERYKAGDKVVIANGTTTYVAVWSANPCNVTFDSLMPASALEGTDMQSVVTVQKTASVHFAYNTPIPDTLDAVSSSIVSKGVQGYLFYGYYDAPVGGTCYYDQNGNAKTETVNGVKQNLTWKTANDSGRLYARWKYRVYLNLNTVYANGEMQQNSGAALDADSTSARIETNTDGRKFITLTLGEPYQLPKVTGRLGYQDTQSWGFVPGGAAKGDGGRASQKMRLDSSGTTILDNDANKVLHEPLVEGGTYPAPLADMTSADRRSITLYADWSTPVSIKVKLWASYSVGSGSNRETFVANPANPATIDALYDRPLLTNMTGVTPSIVPPSYKADPTNTYESLVFKGYSTSPNRVDSYTGTRYIDAHYADDGTVSAVTGTDASGKALPFRETLSSSDVTVNGGAIVLYAIWGYPTCSISFNLNLHDATTPAEALAYNGTGGKADDILRVNGEPVKLTAKTQESTPALTNLYATKPSRGNYIFNGWWTHPSKETGADTAQYYDENNAVVTTKTTWDRYADTVLYAHWKYKIVLDANVPVGTTDADKVKLRHSGSSSFTGTYLDEENAIVEAAYGNTYYYTDVERKYLVRAEDIAVEAIAGSPVKLPFAMYRTGYTNTVIWKESGNVVPVTTGGWTTTELGGTNLAAMRIAGTLSPEGVITLYADWSGTYKEKGFDGGPKIYTVNLLASYAEAEGEASFDVVTRGTETLQATYDKPLSVEGGKIVAPTRNGYTFAGYWTDPAGEGTCYIFGVTAHDAQGGALSIDPWKEDSATGEVNLYAAWTLDDYPVVFDLSVPGADEASTADPTLTRGTVRVTENDTRALRQPAWHYGDTMTSKAPFPVASTVDNQGFFRNGYDFTGWYYINEDGESVMVSNAAGTGLGDPWTPSMDWQNAHKGQQNTVRLYAAWTPKTYAVRFNLNRPGLEKTEGWLPTAQPGYYELAFEDDLAPYLNANGEAALPAYEQYRFAYWGTNTNSNESNAENTLFGNGQLASGKFMPDYPLSTQTKGAGPVARTIDYYGHWIAPEKATVIFFAGEHGRYSDKKASDAAAGSDATKLVFDGIEYTDSFDLASDWWEAVSTEEDTGYTLAGFVWADPQTGEPLEDVYDVSGQLLPNVEKVTLLEKLYGPEPTALVAVYSRATMSVTLDIPKGASVGAWKIDGQASDQGRRYPFSVEDGTFELPTEVAYAGEEFLGWRKTGTTDTPALTVSISPTWLAAQEGSKDLEYTAVFAPRAYKVNFVANHSHTAGADSVQTVYLDHAGCVLGGTLVDAGEVAKGTLLAVMPQAPYPDATEYMKEHFDADEAARGDHYHSYVFGRWLVGRSGLGAVAKVAGAAVSQDDWSTWFSRFATTLTAKTDSDKAFEKNAAAAADGRAYRLTDEMNVYGSWDEAINAVCPLVVTMAVDPETGSVAIPDRDYGIYSYNGKPLEVAALRYERVTDDAGAGLFDNAAGDTVNLNVFTGLASAPSMGDVSIENGIVSGDYGKRSAVNDLLQIELTAPAATYFKAELAGYGFTRFTGQKLMVHYGLDLDGVHKTTLDLLRERLPKVNGSALDAHGWTTDTVPVARLFYTVQTAS